MNYKIEKMVILEILKNTVSELLKEFKWEIQMEEKLQDLETINRVWWIKKLRQDLDSGQVEEV